MTEKTSLERSHSGWSNFKLTLLCIVTTIAVTCFWVGLALVKVLSFPVALAIILVSALVTAGCVFLFSKFKR